MIVELKVGIVESPETGETVEWTLTDPEGRVVFRFGLVGPSHPASKDPMYGLLPEFFGLKMGDRVLFMTDPESLKKYDGKALDKEFYGG